MTALLKAIAEAGERLVKASNGEIDFDAQQALWRGDELELASPGLWSPNRHCRLIQTKDDWIAVSLARQDDIDLLPAWIGTEFDAEPWEALITTAAQRTAKDMVETAIGLHLPVALAGESDPLDPPLLPDGNTAASTIIDLSALWAGPYCGGLLAEAGHRVIKIESPGRPDPTALHTPKLNNRLNGKKEHRCMNLATPDLLEMIDNARVIITSARPHALARLGLNEKQVFVRNPDLLWIAITAHGWNEKAAMRVGFGDDCAVAGGLINWDEETKPQFIGDALADPLTGLMAATLALEALDSDKAGLLDISLARTAATFARKMT